MDSHKKCRTLEDQEQERLRQRRKEWRREQELDRKHNERKLKMIDEYERKRAEIMKLDGKQKSPWRSKSNSPQRRKTSSPNDEHSKELTASVIVNDAEGIIIDEKELHEIKIYFDNKSSLLMKGQNTLKKIERDIIDPDNVILPRRKSEVFYQLDEGACPLFKKNEIKAKETRIIAFTQDEQSEKQLSTCKKNVSTCRKSPNNNIIQHYCLYKSSTSGNDRTYNDDGYNHDRRRNNTLRDSKEKDKEDKIVGGNRSLSRYSSCNASLIRDQSRSRYRSRSHSPTREQARERKVNNNRSKFSYGRNYPDQSRELDDRAYSTSFMGYSSFDSIYNPYIRLSRSMPMPVVRPPPIFIPVFPGMCPAPFPHSSMNIFRWQPPPKFIGGRGIGPNTNRYSTNKKHG